MNFPENTPRSSIVQPGLSDHFIIELIIEGNYRNNPSENEMVFLFEKANHKAIQDRMLVAERQIERMILRNEEIDSVYEVFTNALLSAKETWVPTRRKYRKRENEPIWFNKNCRTAVNKQRKLYNKYKRTQQPFHLEKYRTYRRESRKFLRSQHRLYMNKRLFEPLMKGDSRAFYSYMKTKRDSCNNISHLVSSNGKMLENPVDVANELNSYFKSVFNPKGDSHKVESSDSLEIKINVEGVKALIKGLKAGKAPGPDAIGKNELSMAPDQTAAILTKIFQYSFDSASLPSVWKLANVAPIHKGGLRSCPGNYRPVSLTCVTCKMLERIVLHNMREKLNSIVVPNQHGFREGLSCTTQLLTTTQSIMSNIDKRYSVKAAVLDFAKAFDKVPHDLLLKKLESYSFPRVLLNWIIEFLSQRKQRVLVQGDMSDVQEVTSGVPQGSVLGPALFLLYINDIATGLTSNIRLFADDALMHLTINEINSHEVFQDDLNKLENWASQ